MKKKVAEYILALHEAACTTHQAEDRSLYDKYLAEAAVLLAMLETNADSAAINDVIKTHERLWGNTWLRDPAYEKPSKAWQKVKKCFSF